MGAAEHDDVLGAVWTLVRTDFKVRYHGTVMGFFWALLKPLLTLAVLLAVFQFVFGSAPNYALDLVIGIFLYEFFQESTKAGIVSLATRGYLINRSTFPRWIFVLTSLSNALITVTVFSVGLLVVLCLTGRPPGLARAGLYFLYVAQLGLIVCGFSLATSALFVRYRDLNQVWEVLLQMGFFYAPVVYPLGALPEQYHAFLYLWPPTPVLEFARSALSGEPLASANGHALLAALSLGSLLVGVLTYRALAARVAEHL